MNKIHLDIVSNTSAGGAEAQTERPLHALFGRVSQFLTGLWP